MPSHNALIISVLLIYCFGIFPSLGVRLRDKNMGTALKVSAAVSIAGSAYLVIAGVVLALAWANPFIGQGDRLAGAVHNPRGWMIVAMIIVWPYLLIACGLFTGYIGCLALRQRLSS